MKDLLELLENNFEDLGNGVVWAEWLNEDQKDAKDAKGMLKQMFWLDDECKSLLEDDRVELVVDDRALIVNVF
tara:strand:- start:106 stop:324 length:219 start_codon:yes stop_codon:yes gene_type:complete